MEVHDIEQEAGIKTIPKKKKWKRQDGCLRRAYKKLWKEEKWQARRKGGYTHLNAEFQRIAMRYKKDFLSYQCKEIEENKRMGKTGENSVEIP